jgi:hypothetical protein
MLLTREEFFKMIIELQNINEDVKLIDFLRRYYYSEYNDIFKEEMEEKIRIAKERFSGEIFKLDQFDIRKYTYYLLINYFSSKLNISKNYSWLKLFKGIVFYKNIIKNMEDDDIEFRRENDKIKEHCSVYRFTKALMSDSNIDIKNYQDAIKTLGLHKLTQSDLDVDEYYMTHDFLIRNIFDYYLYPFIEEYKNYLKKLEDLHNGSI